MVKVKADTLSRFLCAKLIVHYPEAPKKCHPMSPEKGALGSVSKNHETRFYKTVMHAGIFWPAVLVVVKSNQMIYP